MTKPSRRSRGGVTIQDVARLAGVSPMTVSRVVNGEKSVRQSTRGAVLEAVRELNYSPNAAARSLAGAEATHIGLLYSNPSEAYLSRFLVGTMESCRRAGCQLVIDSCAENEAEEREACIRLVNDGVEGVILPAPMPELRHVVSEFTEAGLPMVAVAVGRPPAGTLNVKMDDRRAAYEVTAHLLELGHRSIGHIRGHPSQSASEERWCGFAAALKERGLNPEDAPVEQGFFSYRSGLDAAERLLTRAPGITAVFASNDDMAAATVNVAHRRGLQVPLDLSVAGFDDTAIATTVWPELTTIRQPISEMAGAALDLLLTELRARRSGEPLGSANQILEHALVLRESTAPPRSRA